MRARVTFAMKVCGITAALAMMVTPMLGQAAKAAPSAGVATHKTAKGWMVPRTVDGHPDFQGYWTNATYTPFQRPADLGSKEFYTEKEAIELENRLRNRFVNQPRADNHYDNRLWQDESYVKGISNRRTSMIFDPPNGRLPALNARGQERAAKAAEEGRRRAAAESAQSRTLAERCITWGNEGPPMLGAAYNANLQIHQTGDAFVILHEMIHSARIVALNGKHQLPASVGYLGGNSVGHWDGDTLVIDTTNFADQPPLRDVYSSREMHVVERLTRVDAETILYRFTVEDPGTWTAPWSGELMMKKFEGPIYEYACHEGNYGLPNILRGARALEKAAKAAGN